MIEVPSPSDRIVVVGDFKDFTPEELYDHWTRSDLLEYWWPAKAEADPKIGGHYAFSWPDMGWYLQGNYTAAEPGKHLGFTWTWNHEPGTYEPLQVDLYFAPIEEGTRLAIYHGPFTAENTGSRQGIIEGWLHFGMRLAGLRRRTEE